MSVLEAALSMRSGLLVGVTQGAPLCLQCPHGSPPGVPGLETRPSQLPVRLPTTHTCLPAKCWG